LGSLRVSLGIHTTPQEIEDFAIVLPGIIAHNRSLAEPFPQSQKSFESN
jgi:cysteine sulfinate desulfinase/cysteine desulfurase-like protein